MPEQQASPSCTQPPSTLDPYLISQPQTDGSTTPLHSAKRTYLSLLPPPQLIDLILAIDANRDTCVFPFDLDSAIEALRWPRQQHFSPSGKDDNVNPPVKTEPSAVTIPHQSSPTPFSSFATPQPTLVPFVDASAAPSPPASVSVKPPQYKPPPHKIQPHAVPQMYSHAHLPYYPPTAVPQTSSSPVPPPSAPPRHPLFTSAPLSRDAPNATSKPAGSSVSSRDDPNAMPSYEEMLVEAIIDVGDTDGTAPKVLFSWMASHYPVQQNFRPSASQALHKALRRGRLEKIGGKYRLNPEWGGGPTTSKRATRRPTAGNATMSPPTAPAPTVASVTPMPATIFQYGYHYGAPYPYYATPWMGGQPVVQPLEPVPVPCKTEKTDEMEEDEVESEEVDSAGKNSTPAVLPSRDRIKQSLIRLADVLKRLAKKGEGTVMDISGS